MSDFYDECEDRLGALLGEERVEALIQAMLDAGVSAVALAVASRGELGALRRAALTDLRRTGDPLAGIENPKFHHLGGDPALALLVAGVNRRYLDTPLEIFNPVTPESRVLTAIPGLAEWLDEDGLVNVDGFAPTSYGLVADDHALHYHQLLRRGFAGSMNDPLMALLVQVGSQPGNTLRVGIDERRLTIPSEMARTIEEDFWHGPPLSEAWLDNPHGVGTTVHRYPEGDFKRELGYDAIFANWRLMDEGKALQMEELTYPEAECGEDLQVIGGLRGLRYLHAIRDIEAKHFIHCDGAVRAYDQVAFEERKGEKMPTRTPATKYRKVFRIDGAIDTDEWSDIAAKWYQGNSLAVEYLGLLGA